MEPVLIPIPIQGRTRPVDCSESPDLVEDGAISPLRLPSPVIKFYTDQPKVGSQLNLDSAPALAPNLQAPPEIQTSSGKVSTSTRARVFATNDGVNDEASDYEMSVSKESRPSEGFHQEYIASLRYCNDLPPPEMPPKFLDIPHEGLERFLTPGFASNMARREEPNIDVDAEGGMPIDLVGIPGLHLGDESAIMAPENPPPVDPADLPLLTSLDQLRNPAPKNANVSFLRRTQYITAGTRGPEGVKTTPGKVRARQANDKAKVSNDDPTYIKKYITKGFDIAYPESKHTGEDTADRIKGHTPTKAELDAWANPVHPDNPKLKPVGFYPILPDLQGFPDPGGFVQFKFDKIPVQPVAGKRDERMDVAILSPSAPEDRICQDHAAKVALHKANPSLYPDPGPIPWDYDLFLPEQKGSVKKIKRSLSISDPDRDNEDNYTHEEGERKFHRYDRIRTYATSSQTLNTDQRQRDIAVTLFDPEEVKDTDSSSTSHLTQKAAYYYPILGKTRLQPERARKLAKAGLAPTRPQAKEDQADQIHVVVRDPDEAEIYKRSLHRAAVDPNFAKTMPPPPEGAERTERAEGTEEAEGANGEKEPAQEEQGDEERHEHNEHHDEEGDSAAEAAPEEEHQEEEEEEEPDEF